MAKKNQRQSDEDLEQDGPAEIPKYWIGNVHIPGVGTVNGKAKPEDVKAFQAACNPETDINDWLKDEDLLAKQLEEQRRRVIV